MPHNPQGIYSEGSEIVTETILTAHHKGHHFFKACPMTSHDDVPTQACFDQHPLDFVRDELYGAVPDSNYPERAYIAPKDVSGAITEGNPSGMLFRHVFKLPPGLTGKYILLQWVYVTGNSCNDIGYNDYNWPAHWGSQAGLSQCPQPLPSTGDPPLPEQFFNCVEVIVNGDGSPIAPSPTPPMPTTPSPTPPVPTPPSPTPPLPTPPNPTPPSSCPAVQGGGCGPGNPCSNGMCCSQWGWCGETESYCGECCQSNCGGGGPPPPTVNPPFPTPTLPPPPTTPPPPSPPLNGNNDNRLIAYLGNWQSCPTSAQIAQYTHIVVAFAVSYIYSPSKNVCDAQCRIGTPVPVCNNGVNQALVDGWRASGKKVILSFGGAGMGGSWAGDVNDCWDYCFGKEDSVVDQLDTIVRNQHFDGVDLDYEYFYNTPEAQYFIETVTVGLRQRLPVGSIVTHAPMDSDMREDTAYYNIIKNVASSLDFLMPQYYNGITRPVVDGIDGAGAGSVSAISHYNNLVNNVFNGDPTKIVFGFCITDCSGTGSNANGLQAKDVMLDLFAYYPCNGGAFFWVALHDSGAGWSSIVNDAIAPIRGCSSGPTLSPIPPTMTPPSTTSPTPIPSMTPTLSPVTTPTTTTPVVIPTLSPVANPTTVAPVQTPTLSPVASPITPSPTMENGCIKSCPPSYTGLKSYNACHEFYHCVNGVVTGDLISCNDGTLFDVTYQFCNWKDEVTCEVNVCDGKPTDSPIVTMAPTVLPVAKPSTTAPVKPPPTTGDDCSLTCPPNYTGYKAYNACEDYYYCASGVLSGYLQKCPKGTLWDEAIQNFNWPNQMICNTPVCGPTPAPVPAPPTDGRCCGSAGYTGLKAWDDCKQYYHCVGGVVTGNALDCPAGTLFDFVLQVCNWKDQVTCSETNESCD